MKEKIAVATVQGKPYFLLVNQLREHNIPFISLVPGETVPAKVILVITTEPEKNLVKHDKILVFHNENELDNIVNEVRKTLLGKEKYEKIVIGLDPGEATGLAVLADGKVIEQSNCYSAHEVVNTILKSISNIDYSQTSVIVKIGNGVPLYRVLLEELDTALPPEITLEVVGEAGTNKPYQEKHRSRKIRHISSAIRIAGRNGRKVERRKMIAANGRNQ
jgi:hypothetical protein